MKAHVWVAAVAGVLGLVAAAGHARAQADKVAATVNGRNITLGEIEAALQMRGPSPVELSAAKKREMQMIVLGALIDGVVWEQYLLKNGPKIDDAEVSKRMAELEQQVKKAGKTMKDYYKDTSQTEKQVRDGLKSILQWDAISRAKISDADVKRYYDENKDFFDKVTVRASHILLSVPAAATEEERKAARDKLLAIRAHIVAGKLDFAKAAKDYSQCPTSSEGGDIGTFPRKMVVEEAFAKTAFAMKVGEVSDIVQTEFGLHLIKVTGREPGEPSDFEKIKGAVREFCAEELLQDMMAQQRKAAKVEVLLK